MEWIINEKSCRDYDGINGEPTEFEWNIFPGFTTLQLCGKVTDLLSDFGETPETFTGRILFMSQCSTTFLVTEKAIKKNVWQMPKSSPYLQGDSVLDSGHLLVFVLKRSGTVSVKRQSTRNFGSNCGRNAVGIHRKRTSDFPCNDSIVSRKSQKQRTWKTVYSLLCRSENN